MNLKTFLENFDTIAEAPGGISKLRSLILDLAVRGKLVPQNPEDEPAELLRNQIVVEKQNLEKLKKIAKQRSLTPVQEDEQPYVLPSNWCWCRWNDVALHIGDIDHKMPTEVSEGIPYVSPRDFKEENTIDFEGAKKISYEDFERLKRKVQPTKGDIIFPRYGTIGENRLVEVDIDFLASYSCAVIKNFHGYIEPKYSYYYSISKLVKSEIERYTNKTTQANVGIQSIQNFIYPLPPLAEQKRIVEKVDELMGLCDRYESAKQARDNLRQKLRESAIASLMNAETDENLDATWAFVRDNWHNLSQNPEDIDTLRQVILQLAVRGKIVPQNANDESALVLLKSINSDKRDKTASKGRKANDIPLLKSSEIPYLIPDNWKWIRLSDILLSSFYGPRFSKEEYTNDGIVSIRTTDMTTRGEILLKDPPRIPISKGKLDLYKLEKEDLLVTRSGSIGTMAIFRGDYLAIPSAYLIRFRFSKFILVDYIYRFLQSPFGQSLLGLGTTKLAQPNINANAISRFALPLPPLAEQKRIVAKVDELMQLCDRLEASLRESQQRAESLAASAVSHLTI
ncbi:MAG: restriction endonuclease subunit S [Desertifilum sp.]|nr:restriction endonuclease subunit S [Desertifilum sp.]